MPRFLLKNIIIFMAAVAQNIIIFFTVAGWENITIIFDNLYSETA